jgi:uncharacterized protein involved in type VI secretion and phage assembly
MKHEDALGDVMEVMEGRFFGKYRGLVTDTDDPIGRGRVQVRVPAVMGDEQVWALPCAPYGGENMGLYTIPDVDTGVWVEFEAGNPSYPIWVGCFWGDNQVPKDETDTQATPPLKIIRSREGLMVTLNDEEEVITISDQDGSNIVTIEVRQGKIRVEGALKVVVEAPQIELVENATHPVVFGDNLLRYLNQIVTLYQTHTHPPLLSPPVPPFPPATPELISTRVKSG